MKYLILLLLIYSCQKDYSYQDVSCHVIVNKDSTGGTYTVTYYEGQFIKKTVSKQVWDSAMVGFKLCF